MREEWLMALVGGLLIGTASAVLLFLNGRIFGVSGILGGALLPERGDTGWRYAALLGLLAGGLTLTFVFPAAFDTAPIRPMWAVAAAGLFVGFGTRLGSGCTSGHGVCGVSRLSVRSLVATMTFIGFGVVTATLFRLFWR
jgi:uncharacterized membrane protein YedE/YeeE